MATKYEVHSGSDLVGVRARKDAAVKLGESLGKTFRVFTDTGKLVYEHRVEDETVPTPPVENAEEDVAPAGEGGGQKFDLAAMKRKITGLLAKAESTDNEAERDAFTAKAETLMLRLGIQAAELESSGEKKGDPIVEEHFDFAGIYARTMVGFTSAVARGFGNLTILQSQHGQRRARVFVIGHKTDVTSFMTLLASLNLQSISAVKVYQKQTRDNRTWMSAQDKFVTDRSFLEGFGLSVSSRLSDLRKKTETEASTGAALVLASKQDKVDAWVAEKYTNLRKSRGASRMYSPHGAAAGHEAGKKANIGGKSVGGKRGEITR